MLLSSIQTGRFPTFIFFMYVHCSSGIDTQHGIYLEPCISSILTCVYAAVASAICMVMPSASPRQSIIRLAAMSIGCEDNSWNLATSPRSSITWCPAKQQRPLYFLFGSPSGNSAPFSTQISKMRPMWSGLRGSAVHPFA